MDIQVFRPKQFIDMARDYKLLADGEEIAIIKRGETQLVSIPYSAKTIQAKIDWCTSQTFPVDSITSKGIVIKNSFASNRRNIFKMIFLPTYYITFGKGKYLSIENGI